MVGKKRKNKKSKDKSDGKPAPVPPRGPLPLPRAWEPSSKQKLFEGASRQRISPASQRTGEGIKSLGIHL